MNIWEFIIPFYFCMFVIFHNKILKRKEKNEKKKVKIKTWQKAQCQASTLCSALCSVLIRLPLFISSTQEPDFLPSLPFAPIPQTFKNLICQQNNFFNCFQLAKYFIQYFHVFGVGQAGKESQRESPSSLIQVDILKEVQSAPLSVF